MIVLQEGTSTISINGTSYDVPDMPSGQQDISVTVEDSANPQCTTTKTVSVYKCDLSNITNFTYTVNGTAETGAFTTPVSLSSGQTMQVTGVTGTDDMEVTYRPSSNEDYSPNPPSKTHLPSGDAQYIDVKITDQNGCITNRQIQVNSQVSPDPGDPSGGVDLPGGGDPPGGGGLLS